MAEKEPIFVSFFTPEYAQEASGLIETLDRFGLAHDVLSMPARGSWTENCGIKPSFILSRLQEYPDRGVVWLDADARVRKPPELFKTLTCDFAAHWRHGSELLSGTMFFGPTPQAYVLADTWSAAQATYPDEWDQRVLQRIIENDFPVTTYRLPSTYTRIFDDPKMGEPVIEHLQRSRVHKVAVS